MKASANTQVDVFSPCIRRNLSAPYRCNFQSTPAHGMRFLDLPEKLRLMIHEDLSRIYFVITLAEEATVRKLQSKTDIPLVSCKF